MLRWPEKQEYKKVLDEDLGAATWYALDQLLPKESRSAKSMTIRDLATVLGKTPQDLDAVRAHPLLIYLPKSDALAPFLRTEVVSSELFFDEPDLDKKLELKASPVHGTGCFSRGSLPRGIIIRNSYKGVVRYLWDLETWSREADCYNMSCPLQPDLLAYCPLRQDAQPAADWKNPYVFYVNQHKSPEYPANVRYYESKRYPWLVWLKTLAPIRAGQELLLDSYGATYDF